MKVEAFEAAHLAGLRLQAAQAYLQPLVDAGELGTALAQMGGPAFTGTVDGRPVAAAGVFGPCHYWPHAMAWALLTDEALARHGRAFARHVRDFLDGWREAVDTTIDPRCPTHARWAKWLGFTRADTFPLPRPDGAIVDLWRRGAR